MNECRIVRRLLALHAADRNERERSLVEAHLARCPGCRYVARLYVEQDRLIRAVSYTDGASMGQAGWSGGNGTYSLN